MAVLQDRTLSNRTVATLSVERDTVFWDRELTGFGVRVYPSGGKVFVAQARGPDGPDKPNKPRRITVGRHPVLSAEQARQRAALIIARVKAGEDPVPLPLPAKYAGGPTVTDLANRYLEEPCRCPLQAEDAADGPQRRQPPHRAGARQTADRRSGAPTRHGAAREPVRDPCNGEHDGRDPEPHVRARQGLGHGARGLR